MPPPTSARLPVALAQQIVAAARAALPNESVGLLVGRDGALERYVAMVNAAASPYRYAIDPQEQLRVWTALEDAGESVWAIVHSHVATAASPSKTDIELAYFPESLYLICSLADPERPVIRARSISAGIASPIDLDVIP